jgi:hypothetical protein
MQFVEKGKAADKARRAWMASGKVKEIGWNK